MATQARSYIVRRQRVILPPNSVGQGYRVGLGKWWIVVDLNELSPREYRFRTHKEAIDYAWALQNVHERWGR